MFPYVEQYQAHDIWRIVSIRKKYPKTLLKPRQNIYTKPLILAYQNDCVCAMSDVLLLFCPERLFIVPVPLFLFLPLPLLILRRDLVQIVIPLVKPGRILTVDFIPPLTAELFLVKNRTIGAQKRILDSSVLADVNHLAGRFKISVVTT